MKSHLTMLAGLFMAATSLYANNSDSAQFYFHKGIDEKSAKRFQVASQHFDKAVVFEPAFKEAYLQNAYTNLEMRRTDKAKALFVKVYELDPSDNEAIKELAEIFFSYRQFKQAIEFAQKAKGLEDADRIIAISNYHLEDYVSAVNMLKKVLAKNPTDAEATYTMARSYLDMEDYKNSVPYYEKAVALDKTKNAWMYELGLLCYTNEDFKKASYYINMAGENGYQQSNDFNENLGYAYLYSGDFEKGEKLLLVLWAKKNKKDILRDIAEACYKQSKYDKSLEYCQKLMEIDMQDAKALYQAGLCFQKKGEKSRGQQMCDKAIDMDPSLGSMRQKKMDFSGL